MKISEYYDLSTSYTTYILYTLRSLFTEDVPEYLGDTSQVQKLDLIYRDFHSGDKCVSPYVLKTYENSNNTISTANTVIANTLVLLFKDKWDKLYNSLVSASYEALSNYDITEVETPDITTEDTTQDNTFGFDTESDTGEPKDLRSFTREVTGTNTKERTGRDGRVTAQKLLEQELTVRKNLFYDILFSDLDSILTLRIYD